MQEAGVSQRPSDMYSTTPQLTLLLMSMRRLARGRGEGSVATTNDES